MPVRWNMLKVSEAMDHVEELVDEVAIPLEEAEAAAAAARQIQNLPGYMVDRLRRLEDSCRGTINRLRQDVESVRSNIPADDLAREKKALDQMKII